MLNRDNITIFFDLDGVLADFARGTEELAHTPRLDQEHTTDAEDDIMWKAIAAVPHFYDRLELLPGARELFDTLYARYPSQCAVLTGIPKPRRGILTAREDKILWAHRNLAADLPVHVVYKEEKPRFCTGPECILIDDYSRNVEAWRAMGGTGIHHTDPALTFRRLRELGILD